ncbi:hypothetical protein ABPG75_004051 [Micractinium tetrahymenae]
MPKRSADALQAVVPAPKGVEGPSVKSRSGRVVRPKVWDDGTLAAPLAALKEDALGEQSPSAERGGAADAADPDFAPQLEEGRAGSEEARASGGRGGQGAHSGGSHRGADSGAAEDYHADGAFSDDSPRASVGGGSQGSLGRARSSSVGRDEHGKFTAGPRPRGRGGGRGGRGEGGGGIFKQAAVEVLRLEKRLMSTGEIARVALKRGLIKCTGKTPEATMASALYTDIKRKEGQSVFIRPHEGLFGLREWIEQGVAFQDEFAEEMAKRARAAYGVYGVPGMPPMLPPMMDAEGNPIGAPYPMMPFAGMPPIPGVGLPLGMVPGVPPAAAAAAAAAAGKGGADDSPDGLMELLSAAEELHKTSSKESKEAGVKFDADGNPLQQPPADAPKTEAAAAAEQPLQVGQQQEEQQEQAEGAEPMEAEQAAAGEAAPPAPASSKAPQQQQQQQQDAAAAEAAQRQQQPAGSEAGAAAGAEDDEDDAAAMLAAVAEAAAEEPTSWPSSGAAAGPHHPYHPMQYPYHPMYPAPYGFYPPLHYLYGGHPPPGAVPGLPPLPRGRGGRSSGGYEDAATAAAAGEVPPAGSSGSIDLVVLGSNRPFTAAAGGGRPASAAALAAAAAMHAEGQEQVNILNLPLPEVDSQGGTAAHGSEGGAVPAPASAVEPSQLKEAEAQVMALEKELGTSHPEVGKAYLSLSRLYLAGCAESASKQLAVAALSRAAEIMNVCQLALKRQPSCTSSFSYLMDRIRTAEQRPTAAAAAAAVLAAVPLPAAAAAAPLPAARPLGEPVAHGEDAHVTLPAGSPLQAH